MVKTVTETKFHASMYSYLLKISFTTPARSLLLAVILCHTELARFNLLIFQP